MSHVMSIFACTETFMGEWLTTNPHDKAFETWLDGVDGYNDDTGLWKANTCLEGQVWYRYTCMNDDAILTGIDEEKHQVQVRVYPNPAKDFLTVEFSKTIETVEVVDLMVRAVSVSISSRTNTSTDIDVSALHAGIYWLRTEEFTRSFVVE
jgi:hypothetical protein